MTKPLDSEIKEIAKRKKDHLKISTSEVSQIGDPGFNKYRFIHNSLPELNFEEIDTTYSLLGKNVNFPFFISCMTGGVSEGKKLNRNLAKAAQKYKIPMGVGSQRIAIEHPELEELFNAREDAPDIPLLANIGLVQLNYGFGLREYQKCIDMIEADALVIHINPMQEIVQIGGDRNWKGLTEKLSKFIDKLSVPVIAKEVGFGLSGEVVKKLHNIGIKMFDTAGWGGTNWAIVEGLRGKADKELAETISTWGMPTTDSIKMVVEFRNSLSQKDSNDMVVMGSGGIRSGIDIAKALAMGSDLAGIASPFAKAALVSQEAVEQLIERYANELKVTMFGVGAQKLDKLKETVLLNI